MSYDTDLLSPPPEPDTPANGDESLFPPPPPPVTATATATPPETDNAPKPKKRRVQGLAIGAFALIGVSALVGSFIAGWLVKDAIQAAAVSPTPEVIEVPMIQAQSGEKRVPDVRGLSVTDAKQALADTGFDAARIQVEAAPWAGEPGLVISQDPVVGEVLTGSIVLTISEVALMPDLAGLTRSEAIEAVRTFGAEVEVSELFRPDTATGQVLDQAPMPGTPIPEHVFLTISQPGSAVFLSQLTMADDSGRCSEYSVSLNGKRFEGALSCSAGREEGELYSWALGRHATYLSMVMGISDSAPPGTSAKVQIFTDGNEVYSGKAQYGTTTDVGVDLEGILRLEIVITGTDREDVYFGDALVKGTDDKIANLEVG